MSLRRSKPRQTKYKILNHFKGDYLSFYGQHLDHTKKLNGNEYRAICPFHEDTNPSLNFNAQNGKYICHGCGKKGDIFHFYAEKEGLQIKHDFKRILRGIASDFGIPWESKKRTIVNSYDYTDAKGNLLFQVCRMKPKDFRQRRPDGNGGWIWNLNGLNPVLYKLTNVLKAQEVIIVEGEKDADSIASLGLVGTAFIKGKKDSSIIILFHP